MLLPTEILNFAVTYYNLLKRKVYYDVSKHIELQFILGRRKLKFYFSLLRH